MSKRVFRLFWSLDIIKIEKWLCEMAAKGYHLKGIETVKRVFVFDKFDKGESRGTTYRICYNKEGVNVVGQALTNNGWYCAFTKKKWSVLANENDETQIKINPSREGLLNRNRIVKYAVAIILGIYLMTQMLPIFLLLYIFFPRMLLMEQVAKYHWDYTY